MERALVRYFGLASGRVQGVGFRRFVQKHAQAASMSGWVRNMADGTVAMEIQGTAEQIEALAAKIKKGSWLIRVDELELKPVPLVSGEQGFFIEK